MLVGYKVGGAGRQNDLDEMLPCSVNCLLALRVRARASRDRRRGESHPVSVWSHQAVGDWLATQLRAAPDRVVQKIEELLAQGIVVEVLDEPDWSKILPLLDADSRESLNTVLQLPSLSPAEQSVGLDRWIQHRARIQAIFWDEDWWDRLWARLRELAEAGKEAVRQGPSIDSSSVIVSGQQAADLLMRLTAAESGLDLDSLLSLGYISPRMKELLGPQLLEGLGESETVLEPLLSRCRRTAAMCWRCAPVVSHFGEIFGRAYRGFQMALLAIQGSSIEILDARAGWLERLEVERFFVECEQVEALSAEFRTQFGRTPTVSELWGGYYQPELSKVPEDGRLESLTDYRDLLLRRRRGEIMRRLLDHCELNRTLVDLGPIAAPLSGQEIKSSEAFRAPGHTPAEVRVLAFRHGFIDDKQRSFSDIADQFGLPTELVARLESQGLSKLRDKLG